MSDVSHPQLMVICSTRQQASSTSEAVIPAEQPVTAPSRITKTFSQSAIAIALRISKSKPPGLSMKEYLQQLRKHTKTGRPIPQDSLRYIDSTEFWKEQFTKLHLEKKAQDDEIRYLKEAHGLSKKRSREIFEQDIPLDNHEGSIDLEMPRSQSEHLDTPLVNDDFLRLSSYALKIRRHRIALENNTRDCNSLDEINNFAKQTLEVLVLIESALPDCCLPLRLAKDDGENSRISFAFQLLMNQFGLSFLACLTAIDDLCRTIPGRTHRAEVVYRLVMVFKQGLDILRSTSIDQVANEKATRDHDIQHKRQKPNQGECLVSKYLAIALAAIAHNAQWKFQQPAHTEILEGLLFSILEYTGQLLSEAVFGEHVAISDLPGNITQDSAMVKGFVQPEARYIVQVLQAMVGVGNRSGLVFQILATRKNPPAQLPPAIFNMPARGNLLSRAKELLQTTLLKSGLGDADLESLRLPKAPETTSDVNTADSEKYGKDWLIETLWGLIGWDILRSK